MNESEFFEEINFEEIQLEGANYCWPVGKYSIENSKVKSKNYNFGGSIECDTTNYFVYDVFSKPQIWSDFVNINELNKTSILDFVNKYGLLGLAGWYYEFVSQGIDYKSADGFILDNPSHMVVRRGIDYKSSEFSVVGEDCRKKTDLDLPISEEDHLSLYYETEKGNVTFLRTGDWECVSVAEPLNHFVNEVKRAKALNEIIIRLKTKSLTKEILDNTRNLWFKIDSSALLENLWWDHITKNIEVYAKSLIADCIKLATLGIHQHISKNFSWRFSYTPGPPSLLPFIYQMLAIDITKGLFPRHCKSKTCNRSFIPYRDDKIYCSEECKNAEKQRQYRLRQKEVKKDGKRSGSKKT